MLTDELKIVTVKELLMENLTIPNYQRPYRWTTESAANLFNDVQSSFIKNIPEYRIGSVILHSDENKYNIVDGQQRITTLTLLLHCLHNKSVKSNFDIESTPLYKNRSFNTLSKKAITNNHEIFRTKISNLTEEEIQKLTLYILNKCTFVQIKTNSEQEAFQFFDSQNSRGKELSPHDLLKSFHLREMNNDKEETKLDLINRWENLNQKSLALFFEYNLYPLIRYHINKSGLYYSTKKIKSFKGVNQKNSYHFSVYHKAANLYVEHFNATGLYELSSGDTINQFQLTQPLIAGKRFFYYTIHYYDLYQKVIELIALNFNEDYVSNAGSGNQYIRNLFINICIFFADKFNLQSLNKHILEYFYKWCYSLRIVMSSVYIETVNKYALGLHERINFGVNMFARISEMQSPQELDSIILMRVPKEQLRSSKSNSYDKIWENIFGEEK